MSIQFTPDDWARIRKNYKAWWNQELERPLMPVRLHGRTPGRPQPTAPLPSQATCTDLSISPKELIDRIDWELSQYEYLGDSFPFFSMSCFGPGVIAAFLGAELSNRTGRVWFHPKEILPISELHFTYDADNVWLNRIKDIYRCGMDYWQGQVLMGMPDLGGALDILSTFRPGELLLMDLYDEPEEVERLVWEIHDLWLKYYKEFAEVSQPINPGYSDWAGVYSETPSYIVQSDFCYMISPQMFEQFVKPELTAMCQSLDNTIYHMDGIGQLNHLDLLLSIDEIKCVQWQPGDGQPRQSEWPEVLMKIHNAGKSKFMYHSNFEELERSIELFGTAKGIYSGFGGNISQRSEIVSALKRFGVE